MMKVLLIDDDPADRDLLALQLQRAFDPIACVQISRRGEFEAALAEWDFDVVITDYQLKWTDGLWVLRRCQDHEPMVPVVMFTDTGGEEIAVEAMKAGLSDYVLKSHPSRLPIAVKESLEKARLRRAQVEADTALKLANETLERAVAERTAELEAINAQLHLELTERQRVEEALTAALHEKNLLLKEVHHRVKNNLQIISSLLDLQADTVQDPKVHALFEDSQQRIQAVALIHENLYQADNVADISAAEYIHRLGTRVFEAYNSAGDRIRLTIAAEPLWITVSSAIPCGLIINELLSNSLKYAFPGDQAGEVSIALRTTADGRVVLTVSDTGVGFPADQDYRRTDSLGLQLVCLLTEQLGGSIEMNRSNGTQWIMTFPKSSF